MAKMYICSLRGYEKVRWDINEENLYGSWKVFECESPANFENCDLEGSEFSLDETGDIRWKLHHVPSDCLPFLTCDSYELTRCSDFKYKDCDQGSLGFRLNLFGSETGELIVPFLLTLSRDFTVITMRYQYSPMLILKCKKVGDNGCLQSSLNSYSLLPALQDGLFSDMTIIANNGKQFQAHKAILLCACPTVDWTKSPPLLTNWPADAIEVTLHYFYSGTLPPEVQEETVEKIHSLSLRDKGMKNLHEVCAQFLESTALKRKLNSLLDQIYSVADDAYNILNDMKNKELDGCPHGNGLCNPRNLVTAAKQIARHLSLAFARFTSFCEIFTKYKAEMSRDERNGIIEGIKSRLMALDDKVRQCAEIVLDSLSNLTLEEQKELAIFLVPEVDHAVEVGTRLAIESKDALDKVVQSSDHEFRKKPKKKVGMKLSKALRMSLFSKEVQLLKKLQERAASGYVSFFQRREDFNSLEEIGKATLIFNCIQYLIMKGPDKLDEFTLYVPDSKFSLKGWKEFTKLIASKLTWLISKMKMHNKTVEPILMEVCQLVKTEEFSNVLKELELIKPNDKHSQSNIRTFSETTQEQGSSRKKHSLYKDSTSYLSAACPPPACSVLSKPMGALLQTGQFADMKFIICDGPGSTTTTESRTAVMLGTNSLVAHRVVVASRCDWFRRALTSGMKESIERTIHVYDTDKESFEEFLRFIYTGTVNADGKSMETLVELMTLSDRYEVDHLKAICEKNLVEHFKKENIFELLILADRFNAPILKSNILKYLRERKELCSSTAFTKLPSTLQKEVVQQFKKNKFIRCDADVSSSDDSDFDGGSFFPSQPLGAEFPSLRLSDSESSEDEYIPGNRVVHEHLVDRNSLENCIIALQEVLPSDIPREKLVKIALAADCDVNRALNHYFS